LAWANQTLAKGLQDADLLIGCTYGPAWESTLGARNSETTILQFMRVLEDILGQKGVTPTFSRR